MNPMQSGLGALMGRGQPMPTYMGVDQARLEAALMGRDPQIKPNQALAALNKQVEARQMAENAAAQQAIATAQGLMADPTVRDQVLQRARSYAGGGIVAFSNGADRAGVQGDDDDMPAFIRAMPEDSGVRQIYNWIKAGRPAPRRTLLESATDKLRSDKQPETKPVSAEDDDLERVRRREMLIPTASSAAPSARSAPPPAPRQRPESRNKPADRDRTPPTAVEPRTTDPFALDIAQAQEELRRQLAAAGQVDPEEKAAREAYEGRMGDVTGKRQTELEKRLADMEARRKQMEERYARRGYEDPGLISSLAAGAAGARTFGEAISGASRGSTEYLSAQEKERLAREKEFRAEQDLLRTETRLIDDLETAKYERRVAYASGDAKARRAADLKLAEAEKNYVEGRAKRLADLEEDRSEANLRQAQAEQARATAGYMSRRDDGSEGGGKADRTAATLMRADPRYQSIQKELTEARQLAGVSKSPTAQQRLQRAEKAAVDLAAEYGIKIGGASGATPDVGRVIDFQSIK